jgi:hypothetical protein
VFAARDALNCVSLNKDVRIEDKTGMTSTKEGVREMNGGSEKIKH